MAQVLTTEFKMAVDVAARRFRNSHNRRAFIEGAFQAYWEAHGCECDGERAGLRRAFSEGIDRWDEKAARNAFRRGAAMGRQWHAADYPIRMAA